jgi:predicted metalloendopeptidase
MLRKKFPAEAKVKAENDKNIFVAFENRINNLAWMSRRLKFKNWKSKIKMDIS